VARTLTLNYAEVVSSSSVLNADGSVTIEATYVVGYKPPTGPIVYLSHPSFAGPAAGGTVTVTSVVTDTHQQSGTDVAEAIAAKESLNLPGGDTVQLVRGS
jgi:hypothetical protein